MCWYDIDLTADCCIATEMMRFVRKKHPWYVWTFCSVRLVNSVAFRFFFSKFKGEWEVITLYSLLHFERNYFTGVNYSNPIISHLKNEVKVKHSFTPWSKLEVVNHNLVFHTSLRLTPSSFSHWREGNNHFILSSQHKQNNDFIKSTIHAVAAVFEERVFSIDCMGYNHILPRNN